MDQLNGDHDDEVYLRSGHVRFTVRVPATDMDARIRVGVWRALLTLVGVLLVATDIPRTGLIFSTASKFPTAGTGTLMLWGPYEYPVLHLRAEYDDESSNTPSSIKASSDGDPLNSVALWSYKYDTLSIASRAIARHFNVTAYPPCVLYREPCESSKLETSTVFQMLDALMATLATRGLQQPQPLLLISKSHWVDRLHHILFRFLTKNPENRLHSVYYSATNHDRNATRAWNPRRLCRSDATLPTRSLPFFCMDPIPWKCDHPINPTGQRRIPIWDHMSIRFDDLARRHPYLQLDFALTVATFTEGTHSDRHIIPSVSYTTDPLEITTIVRGTQCVSPSQCRTIFIDEYRYERIVIESDVDGWRAYVSVLRGFSQIYIWLRIALLIGGCHSAITAESKHRGRHLIRTWFVVLRAVLKIPSHSIVYSCWFAIIGYALAHHFDSCLVQTVGEFSWASVDGFYNFDPLEYVMRASIQMRNVWMLSVICKLVVYALNLVIRDRRNAVHSVRDGLLTVRGGWISFVSWLTTYSLMRALQFRDTAIVSVLELPSNIPIQKARRAQALGSYTDYGLRFDLKCSLAACVVATGIGWIVKALGCLAHEPIFDVHARTKEIWSMVRLTNIAYMSDPLVLFRLYVIGKTLYLYRVHSSNSADPPYVVLLPTAPNDDEDTDESALTKTWTATRLEYVADINSRDVAWHALVNCG